MTSRLAFVLLLTACAPVAMRAPAPMIALTATAIPLDPRDPSRTAVGSLRYLGGLHLTSTDPRFGGVSGLRWDAGSLVGVTDQGDFLRFRAIETGERLTGVADLRMARLTGLDGKPIATKADGDAEAIELAIDDEVCAAFDKCDPVEVSVAFEGRHRVWRYALRGGLPYGRPKPSYTDPIDQAWLASLPPNGGIEAMADHGDMANLLVAEEKRDAGGRAQAVLYHNGQASDVPASHRQTTALRLAPEYAATDAVMSGDLLILARRYTPADGASAELYAVGFAGTGNDRRIAIGEPLRLATLAPPLNVDNMEGLALREEGGRRFVYMVSDDNFSAKQRTLLLKFELVD